MRHPLFCSIICSICLLCSSNDVFAQNKGYIQAQQKDGVPYWIIPKVGITVRDHVGWKYNGQRAGHHWR